MTPPSPTVRIATAADVPALAALRRQWAEERDGVVDDPRFEDTFGSWYDAEAPRRVTWLAEVARTPIGMVNLAVFERMPLPGRPVTRWGYLSNAYVLAPHRNAGVGAALISALLAHADAEGLVRVVLSPSELSVPLYQRLGFGQADMLLVRLSPEPGS